MNIRLRQLLHGRDEIPYDLLLLADPSRKMIDRYLPRGLCYLAYDGEELVGEFVLLATGPATCEIVNLAVREDRQGQGIGRLLLARAEEEARRTGAAALEIGTGNSSLPQLRLYQQCGFRMIGIDRDFFTRNYEEEIVEDGIPCKDMVRLRKELEPRR